MRWLIVALIAIAAGSSAAASERFSVAFVNPGGAQGFWGAVTATMQAAAEDLSIDLEVIHSDRDRLKMLNAARRIAERSEKPDYVVLVNELEQGSAMMRLMAEAEIPAFFLLNKLSAEQTGELQGQAGAKQFMVGSVTPNNEIAGFEMAQSLIAAVRARNGAEAPVEILAILGDSVTPAALSREAGLRRAVAADPKAEITRAFPVLWNRDEARRRARFALKVLAVDAVWGANDDLALGAAEASQELGRRPGADLFLAGLNWSRPGLDAVASGALTMTHGGHFFGGAWAMVMLRDLHDGAAGPIDEHFAMSAVTPDNVELFIQRLGAGDWRRIDFARFTKSLGGRKAYDFCADAILAAAAAPQR